MVKIFSSIVTGFIIILISLTTNVTAQEAEANAVSPSQEIRIKEEVKLIVEKYYRYFSANEMDKIPVETHTIPWTILGTGRTYSSAEASNENYYTSYANIKKDNPNYARSVFTIQNICVSSPTSAIVSGFNTRKRTDNSNISISGTVYILELTEAGWRINSFVGKALDKIISC
ncbi:MAG: hypothetical protein HOJ34_04875 [Kordiimonadaceae bacterium]|nr:hypothetical protein [Kordiimonadaceae bacterium]MBT6036073.1 hypothetical protein [Kordiimonadaceae bacterium]MBT6329098.1 hypothetical protein [Kordiimonadaceae bacterium]